MACSGHQKKDENSSEEFYVSTHAGCVVRSTDQRRPREDAGDPVFFNSVRGLRAVESNIGGH